MAHAVQILLLEGWARGIGFVLNSARVCGELIPAKINQRGLLQQNASEVGLSRTSPSGRPLP